MTNIKSIVVLTLAAASADASSPQLPAGWRLPSASELSAPGDNWRDGNPPKYQSVRGDFDGDEKQDEAPLLVSSDSKDFPVFFHGAVLLVGAPAADERQRIPDGEISIHEIDRQPVIYVETSPGVTLEQLVKLELFGAFKPGHSLRSAKRQYGPGLYRRSDRRDMDHYVGYESPFGIVEVADQDWSSFPFLWHRRRSLYLYPRSTSEPAGR